MAELDERLQRTLPEHYVVERELGRGGMATVYLAEDRKHHRHVAVKVLHSDYASAVGRFRFVREIEIAASMSHPGILPLFDSGVTDDVVYYVMPYVEGESLRDLLDRELQLPLDTALRIAREVGDALAYAHGHGVVHRDIKPANILLESGHAVVADFGIARAPWAASGERSTGSGVAVGTPQYMSPEQTVAGAVDHRTDVWALGCVVYEMLAGTPPFTGATPEAVFARLRSELPPSLEVVRPGVGHGVQGVVEKALAKVPADRWQSAMEFVEALENAAVAPESGEYVRTAPPVPWWRRWQTVVASAGAVLVVAVAAAVFGPWLRGPALDVNKIVVFPLQARGDSSVRGDGVAIGSLINTALETAEPLKAVDGWTWLTPEQRRDPTLVTSEDLARIARAQHARYALSGWVLHEGDTATVTVALLDVSGDTTLPQVSQAGLFDPDFIADLGLRAVSGLLSRFLARGRRVDLPLLQGHPPAAILATVSGDLAYREGKFERALTQYRRALELDSALVLAALKGAWAATWTHDRTAARALVALALSRTAGLPAKYRDLATGLRSHLEGRADSAAADYGRAIARDSDWTEAWMARGEAHYHLLFGGWNPDSLAEADFERARRLDPGFTPALYHLNEIAWRRGRSQRADSLYRALRGAGPDSSWLRKATWTMQCVRDGPDGVDWVQAARGGPGAASDVVMVGSGVAKVQPVCAERALRAVLQGTGREALNMRWGALVALQSLLVAEGRYREVRRLLEWAVDSVHPAAHSLEIVDALAGVGTDSGGALGILMLGPAGTPPSRFGVDELWWLGLWAWHHRDAERLGRITARVSNALRPGRPDGIDTLIHNALSARLALLRGDSARALALLERLQPRGSPAAIAWEWLSPLAEERLLHARLLLARRRYAEALAVAGVFDTYQPVAYTMYLSGSLEVRMRAAEALGRRDLAARFQERLAQLRGRAGV